MLSGFSHTSEIYLIHYILQQCSLWGAIICAQRQIYQFQPFWHKGNNETFMIIFILQRKIHEQAFLKIYESAETNSSSFENLNILFMIQFIIIHTTTMFGRQYS